MKNFLRIIITGFFLVSIISGCSMENYRSIQEIDNKEIKLQGKNKVWINSLPDEIHLEMENSISLNKKIADRKNVQDIIDVINNAMDLDIKPLDFLEKNKDGKPQYIGMIQGLDIEIKLYILENNGAIYLLSPKGVKSISANSFFVPEYNPKTIPPGEKSLIDEISPIPPAQGVDNGDIKQLDQGW